MDTIVIRRKKVPEPMPEYKAYAHKVLAPDAENMPTGRSVTRPVKRVYKIHSHLTLGEVAFIKCLLGLKVSQTSIAKMVGAYPTTISQISRGVHFAEVAPYEIWSRDVSGFLHERITTKNLVLPPDDTDEYNGYKSKYSGKTWTEEHADTPIEVLEKIPAPRVRVRKN